MSINYQGLEGKTNGAIGELVFFVRKSVNIARKKAINPRNPRTEKQQNNRGNIALLVQFFQQLRPILYRTLNHRPDNRAVYHHFLALNLSVSVNFGVFTPELLLFSGTGLDYTTFSIIRNQTEGNKFLITWSSNISGNLSTDDYIQAILFSKNQHCFDVDLTQHLRSSGSCELLFNEGYKNDECLVFLCFVKQDISISSQSSVHAFAAI